MPEEPKRRGPKLGDVRSMIQDEVAPVRRDIEALGKSKGKGFWAHTAILAVLILALATGAGYAGKRYIDHQEARYAEITAAFTQVGTNMGTVSEVIVKLPTSADLEDLSASVSDDVEGLREEIRQSNAAIIAAITAMKHEVKAGNEAFHQELSKAAQTAQRLNDGALEVVKMIEWKSDQAAQNINAARPR